MYRQLVRTGLSKHVMTSEAQVLELIQRGIARHNLVNRLNVTSRTHAHIVLQYTFTQVRYLSLISTGWPRKNVPNVRRALCNRAGEVNQQKSIYVMSKHLRMCL